MLRSMDSSTPSSGHLADNIDYLMGLSPDFQAITIYGWTTTRRGDTKHSGIHDALRGLLLITDKKEISAHIGDVAYAAVRVGDDQYVCCWKTGSPIAKSRAQAFRRAVKRKMAPAPVYKPGIAA